MTNWKVEVGSLGGAVAYKVHPASTKPPSFISSHHGVCFLLPEKANYKVYSFQDNCFSFVTEKTADKVRPGEFNLFNEIMVSELTEPIVYLVEKSDIRISPYAILKNNLVGALIFRDQQITIEMIKFPIPEESKIPENFNFGPGSHDNQYGINRDNFRFTIPNKEVVVWSGPSLSICMTHIDRQSL